MGKDPCKRQTQVLAGREGRLIQPRGALSLKIGSEGGPPPALTGGCVASSALRRTGRTMASVSWLIPTSSAVSPGCPGKPLCPGTP